MTETVQRVGCDGHWTDAGHVGARADYRLQFGARQRNNAAPLRLCERCTAEYRAWSDDVLWVRSL